MNAILWFCQGFLAIIFLYSGFCKTVYSTDKLVAMGQTGAGVISIPLTRFIGIAEIFGVAGIILPQALNIVTILTPVTAICFAVVMMFAAPIHYRLHEPKNVVLNIAVLLVSLFVAWGRFKGL